MILRRNLPMTAMVGAAIFLSAALPAGAKSKSSSIENAGVAVAIALPIAAGGITIAKNDWTGLAQLVVVTGATVGTALLLSHVVHEKRPDGSDMQSFPSDTAAAAFAPAQFLWDRYGWQYGVPAYLAAGFVGYSRVESKQHHWWDVAASAGLAFGYSKLFTTRYMRNLDIYTSFYATQHSAYVSLDYRW
jgi:membrane-associated phospholipid phosphatase